MDDLRQLSMFLFSKLSHKYYFNIEEDSGFYYLSIFDVFTGIKKYAIRISLQFDYNNAKVYYLYQYENGSLIKAAIVHPNYFPSKSIDRFA